jgi:hypothetical protein
MSKLGSIWLIMSKMGTKSIDSPKSLHRKSQISHNFSQIPPHKVPIPCICFPKFLHIYIHNLLIINVIAIRKTKKKENLNKTTTLLDVVVL